MFMASKIYPTDVVILKCVRFFLIWHGYNLSVHIYPQKIMASSQVYMPVPSLYDYRLSVHGYGCHQGFTDSPEMYIAIP